VNAAAIRLFATICRDKQKAGEKRFSPADF
jgi:hypothetical protein